MCLQPAIVKRAMAVMAIIAVANFISRLFFAERQAAPAILPLRQNRKVSAMVRVLLLLSFANISKSKMCSAETGLAHERVELVSQGHDGRVV